MIINISDVLRSQGATLDYSYRALPEGADFEDLSVGEMNVELKLRAHGTVIQATGILTVEVNLVCDMCLKEYKQTLVLPFDEQFMTAPDSDDPDEIYTYTEYRLSPDKILRDLILLNIPVRCRCSAECGAEEN